MSNYNIGDKILYHLPAEQDEIGLLWSGEITEVQENGVIVNNLDLDVSISTDEERRDVVPFDAIASKE